MEVKERIIKTAYELFSSKGYDRTTVADIIQHARCSKGGFYHHFKSKEEILDVIIRDYIDDLKTYFTEIMNNDKTPFIDRFNAIFKAISHYKLDQLVEFRKTSNIFIFEGNDRVLMTLQKQFKLATKEIYQNVLLSGREQGAIEIDYLDILAEHCAREVLWIFEAALRPITSDDPEEYNNLVNLLNFIEDQIVRSLGMARGTVELKEDALSYLENAKKYYFENKEGLR